MRKNALYLILRDEYVQHVAPYYCPQVQASSAIKMSILALRSRETASVIADAVSLPYVSVELSQIFRWL